MSERLGAGLRRKGCDAYLNGTRAFREVQRCPNEPLKAAKRAAPQSERGTKKTRLRAKFLAQNCFASTNKRQQKPAVVVCRLAQLPVARSIFGVGGGIIIRKINNHTKKNQFDKRNQGVSGERLSKILRRVERRLLPVCKRHTAQKGENEPPET